MCENAQAIHLTAAHARPLNGMNKVKIVSDIGLFFNSGPLTAMAASAIAFLFADPLTTMITPAFDPIFSIATRPVWGVACLIGAVLGYVGLYRRTLWLWELSHAIGMLLFFGLGYGFYQVGNILADAFLFGLTTNAWVRYVGLVKEVFNE